MSISFSSSRAQKWLSSNCEKVTKINLRVISKYHAHLQSLTKIPVKFQKDWDKIVGGVALTKYPLKWWMDGRTDARTWTTLYALPHSSNGGGIINQVTNGPVNAHLTSEQILNTKPGDKWLRNFLVQAFILISQPCSVKVKGTSYTFVYSLRLLHQPLGGALA